MNSDIEETLVIGGVMLALAALIGVLVCGIVSVGNRLEFPMKAAEIEQLRRDSANVISTGAEDVIGQVTQANQDIVSNHACNRTWYCDVLIPDAWDDIRVIEVPKGAK